MTPSRKTDMQKPVAGEQTADGGFSVSTFSLDSREKGCYENASEVI